MFHVNKSSNNDKKSIFTFNRAGGILLHPTSLPGEYGIGDLGPNAYRFVDFLQKTNIKIWQILPLGPTGYGNSPYQCHSAFAGNPYLISFEKLEKLGLLTSNDYVVTESFARKKIDFTQLIPYKWRILEMAYRNFLTSSVKHLKQIFQDFSRQNRFWLEDFSLFMALKKAHNEQVWTLWDENLRDRNQNILNRWKKQHQNDINFYKFVQFLFFKQWLDLKQYASQKNISILGDIPVFLAFDSADVWVNRSLFYLDETGNPTVVAGVPPDYFSTTGQRWGNPLYRWDRLKEQNYNWWVQRFRHTFTQVDIARIDHFRGFEAYWEIPASESTAINGRWIPGPGKDFFRTIINQIGSLPIIAEDLGIITPEVDEIRDYFGFPGMKILQYAFGDDNAFDTRFLPHNFIPNTIVYTGTHDNETTMGWFLGQTQAVQKKVLTYLNCSIEKFVSSFIRMAWQSVAKFAIIPFQDLLHLDNSARMNVPGTQSDNWEWRFSWDQLSNDYIDELTQFSILYERS